MNPKTVCRCSDCKLNFCASKVPVFAALDQEQLEVLSGLIQQKTFLRDENMILEGNELDSLIFIHKGQAKAYRNSIDGRETILYIFTEGDFFGEKNILSNQLAGYSVKAIKKTEVCMIHKRDFQQFIQLYPKIALQIIDVLSHRIERLEKSLERGNQDVSNRIHEVLLEFSKKYGKRHAKGLLVTLPINREGIANYIGVTRETVSRKMTRLEHEGIIEMIGNKKVLILNHPNAQSNQ